MFQNLFIDEPHPDADCTIRNIDGSAIFTLDVPTNTYQIPEGLSPEDFAARHIQQHACGSNMFGPGRRAYPQELWFRSDYMTKDELTSWLGKAGASMGASTIHIRKWPSGVKDDRIDKAERYTRLGIEDVMRLIKNPPTEAIVGFSISSSKVKLMEMNRRDIVPV